MIYRKNFIGFRYIFYLSRNSFLFQKLNPAYTRTVPNVLVRAQLHDALLFKKVKYSDYSINVGYGYNWVFAKNWVSNLSLLPAIAYKKSKIDDIDLPATKVDNERHQLLLTVGARF